ncbi:MAG: hypothetical protein AAFP03_11090 [Cyanobacteria bacterium J06598_3]
MAIAYWTVAGVTFAIVVFAFLSDFEANKRDLKSFAFIAAATLLWPITLPFILRQKYLTAKARHKARKKAKVLSQLQQQLAHSTATP